MSPTRHPSLRWPALASTALLTGALLSTPTTPALAASDTPTEAFTPVQATSITQALRRDLNLSPPQAQELLDAQNKATALTRDAARAAGEAYVEARWDPDTDVLAVSVTDAAAVEAVEATGAEAEVLTHDPDRLASAVEALNQTRIPEGVVSWYGDPFEGTIVIEALDPVQAWDLVEATGVPTEMVRVARVDEPVAPYAQVIGGHLYRTSTSRCTIGFSVIAANGQEGFVTAGHCGSAGEPVESTPPGGTGRFLHSHFPGSDIGFVAVDPGWELTPWVARYGSTPHLTIMGSAQAPIGSAVCRSGPTTGWQCGTLQARNQTVNYPEGAVFGLTRTNLCAEPGDSGGPVVVGDQAQGIVSGGSGNCSTGGLTYYQELLPALNTWNMTLYTG